MLQLHFLPGIEELLTSLHHGEHGENSNFTAATQRIIELDSMAPHDPFNSLLGRFLASPR
jgi:hypothetical protein